MEPDLTVLGVSSICLAVRSSAVPDWARQPQHESGIPGWINVVIALAAIIPIVYLLFRDTKLKVFLKPTEFQELPLEHREVRMPPAIIVAPSQSAGVH